MLRVPLILSRFTTARIAPVSSVRNLMQTPGERTDLNEKKRVSVEEKLDIEKQYQRRLDEMDNARMKTKHIGLMGCFLAVLFGTQAYCLWKRRSDNRQMNKTMPPIKFDKFKEDYLIKGKVAKLVLNPNFGVIDVYLGDLTQEEVKKKALTRFFSTLSTGPERFAPQPDLRVTFNKSVDELEKVVLEIQANMEKSSLIHIENNSYPSYREIALIGGGSTICTIALAIALS